MEQIDDKWIRVSTILASVPSIGTDGKWDFPLNKIDPTVLRNKADLGTSVHAAIASHCEGQFYSLTAREEGYFDSYLNWEKANTWVKRDKEKRFFYEPMKLTGCIDMIIQRKEGADPMIIDFKCSAAADLKKWSLQMAFYEFLCTVNKVKVEKVANLVQLDSEGGFPTVYTVKLTKELTETALSLYNLYCYLTKK